MMGSSCSQVDIIITSTSTNNNLQIFGCLENLGISLV